MLCGHAAMLITAGARCGRGDPGDAAGDDRRAGDAGHDRGAGSAGSAARKGRDAGGRRRHDDRQLTDQTRGAERAAQAWHRHRKKGARDNRVELC